MTDTSSPEQRNFIRQIVEDDLSSGRCREVVTRFPPEPNGYLHIGHAKSICLNFSIARRYGGRCHLRFDDTNPATEDRSYVEAIERDIRWLGFDWGEHLYFASDYFERMAGYAEELIRKGLAYVCDLSPEQFKEYRGVPTRPGREPTGRERSVEENLDLFRRMRAGEFAAGDYVLRARIDMSSPNLHLRDPAIYRIRKATHHRTGENWCVYPMYDFAHGIEDAIEGVTHSICTLEFEVHRPLYDWLLDHLSVPCHPRQIEFARLNLSYTVMSKRRLQQLVVEGFVSGWDDPRMPTLAGLRRRGYTPEAIRTFAERVGVTRYDSLTDLALLEHCIREDLNVRAQRRMAVLNPVKLVIDNYSEDAAETFEAVNNPENSEAGTRFVPFGRELWVERDDVAIDPPPKFHRLRIGGEVRLRYACLFRCTDIIADAAGEVREVHGVYDPASRGGSAPDGRKVRGTIHWVCARHAVATPVRLYDRLFTVENPLADADGDFRATLNPDSLGEIEARLEPSLADAAPGEGFQFERLGYFCADLVDSRPGAPVFNRTVPLRDSWRKISGASS